MAGELSLVPTAIDLRAGRVELLDVGGVVFDEPFFDDTLERVRRDDPHRVATEMDLARFVMLAKQHPIAPDGLVFHVGRCGSTLFTRMLEASGEDTTLREPGVLNELVGAWLSTSTDARRPFEMVTGATIRILLGAAGGSRHRTLKLAAWHVQMASTLLDLFPTTPAVFLARDPEEVVASQLYQPPSWFGELAHAPRPLQAQFLPSMAGLPRDQPAPPELLFAHAWRSAVEAALAVPPARMMRLDYGTLTGRPRPVLSALLRSWGRTVAPATLDRMVATTATYSKGRAGSERFDPRGRHRRPSLTPQQRDRVGAVVGDLWARLQGETIR